ncbi:MAG: hypothetical protein K1Y02_08820 [Candidatus Hydrogenedentes bacterium]|nr:hypothetical protein [Candidatus Hydrogenedentota bacterium]
MFEQRDDALLSRKHFLLRQLRFTALAGLLLGVSLGLGVIGYHYLANLGWVDSLLNASMILTGMGPVSPMPTNLSKLFASAYALFSGIVFLTSAAVLVAPPFHRIIHRFHLDTDSDDS